MHRLIGYITIVAIFGISNILGAQQSASNQGNTRFQFLAGSNIMQPLEFIGTNDASGDIKLGFSFGVGTLHSINSKFSLSSRFLWFQTEHRFDQHISYDENSYFYQKYGFDEFINPRPGLPSTSIFSQGYEVSINLNYNLLKGKHILGPSIGASLISVFSYRGRSVITYDNDEFGKYVIFQSNFRRIGTKNKIGIDFGLHYRFENKKGNAFTADLKAHLYFNNSIDYAEWIVRGKDPNPNVFESGPINYSYNRISLTVGYAF